MSTAITCITGQGARQHADLSSFLGPSQRELARQETNRWIKRLRLVRYDGGTMRERFTYRSDSLWWFTELYLHKMRRLDAAVGVVMALDHACAVLEPARIVIDTTDHIVREAAVAFGRSRRTPVEVTGHTTAPRVSAASFWTGMAARLSRVRTLGRRNRQPPARAVAFVHTAFWLPSGAEPGAGHESYIGPVLDAVRARLPAGELACVGVGPKRNFRARRWWDPIVSMSLRPPNVIPVEALAPGPALAGSLDLWNRRRALARAVTNGAGIRAAAVIDGCDLWPVMERELAHSALLQWPWSAKAMDEAGAALDALNPDVVMTYAEAGGWGRALMLEARRRGLRSVGIQHGFIYRHWLNYLHEPDEMAPQGSDRGFPAPDRTLLFDRYAADHLRSAGHFPGSALAITGSARLDDLSARVTSLRGDGTEDVRRDLGVSGDDKLVVLTAKFSEIREELPVLFKAVSEQPSMHLVVKTHPAETASVYAPLAAGTPNISIAPASADLARLLAAADAVVTMNSTVGIDGLVLGIPTLVIGWPTNLSPLVDAGVMMGGPDLPVAEALRRLLYDPTVRHDLLLRGAAFVRAYEMQPDGRAAARAADEILAMTT